MRLDRRDRLRRALARQPVDRVPVICTGGSMAAAPEQVVARSGYSLPAAHGDARAMAGLALAAAGITGFESVGVPLCTTVEAEAFGAEIDPGDARTEARIVREPYASVADVRLPGLDELLRHRRVALVVAAVRRLAATSGDLPIIANLIGPLSIAASVVDPTTLLRELRSKPEQTTVLSAAITDFLIAWARQLLGAGADAIVLHEEMVTPALVGPRTFERAVHPHLMRLVAAIHAAGGQVLLHMGGALGKSAATVARLGCDGYSPDASLSPGDLREALPGVAIVGNVSSFLLHQGQPAAIAKLADRLIAPGGVDVLAPTCGISCLTPLENILAMTGAVVRQAVHSQEFSTDV